MSAYEDLAKPAPKVGAATAEQYISDEKVAVEPARASEGVAVEPPPRVGPAAMERDINKIAASTAPNNSADVLSVAALRKIGADFESKAAVMKGSPKKNFLRRAVPILFDERDFVSYGEVTRYVFIQGPCCFIYTDAVDQSPLYTINLEDVVAILEDPKKPDKNSFTVSPRINTNEARENLATILLKHKSTGKQAYQFTFDLSGDKSIAKRFMDVFHQNHHLKPLSVSAMIASEAKKEKQ
mmetsp:Transcript_3728/g.10506  ORF Transcript_3728/g.10506 Transcript_3728/m.10506 type:complete len:240 (+) Transcript_3728:89-808(+)|eukprot:CAMPEP_0119552482 /NCGR_PEP_ID=MMETSP1352-20130426/5464_1 /TAXON_ID=265584 /ORGANISM="Stauroneis constricta, Strain CCMP1120" /LENGTH=239 /DNA_ID=CAMNT_0007598723 /DNA_START=73 /DNA_END=792 /DNA_ORIENTATION=+